MKNYLVYFCCLILFVACQPDSNTTATQSATSPLTSSSNEDGKKASAKKEIVHVPASNLAPMIGMWHYEAIVGVKDPNVRAKYEGRWIDLKGDQTFTSGVWQEQTNSGKWSFDSDNQKINFNYATAEDLFDEFVVQGVGGDVVVFKGNTDRTARGVQIKMVKYNDKPIQ